MNYVYIAVPILCILIIGFLFIKKKEKERIKSIQAILSKYGNLSGHHYEIGEHHFQVHLFNVTHNAELVINSPTVWEISQGSNRRLIDQSVLKSDTEKIIIVYPNEEPIKRYINENEMVFLTYKSHFHHMRVIRLNELETFLKEF